MIRTSPLANHAGDLKSLARRRLPRIVYDFLEGGSHDEITMRRNRADFGALFLRQRVFDHFAVRTSQTSILGQRASMPVGLAPIGMSGVFYPRAEICVARAAAAFGVPYCLSTLATCSIEEVSAAAGGPFLFQLFMMKDRAINASLLERAAEAKCPGLVVNVDTAVQGRRNRDLDNGVTIPLNLRLWHLFDLVRRPRWVVRYLGNKPTLANLAPYAPGGKDLASVSDWAEPRFKGAVHTEDLEWLRQQWPGTLIVKGVLDPEDGRSLDLGASVVVSNHGGRQLEGAPSTIEMIPRICDTTRRCGAHSRQASARFDVLKALGGAPMGASWGAPIYGLAAHGRGVAAALHLLSQELTRMTLTALPASTPCRRTSCSDSSSG